MLSPIEGSNPSVSASTPVFMRLSGAFLLIHTIKHIINLSLCEGKARSEVILNQLPTIMPPMIQSIFKEFPGQSGKPRKHSVILPPDPQGSK